MIYGSRVREARFFLGETQTQFSASVGLVQSRLSAIESNESSALDESLLLSIADHTGFPPAFFETPPAPPIDDVQFRSRLTFKAADRNRVLAIANIVHESYARMRSQLENVAVRISLAPETSPPQAAQTFRKLLDLPTGPISNLTFPLENHGVVILALPIIGKKHDAFCWWQSVQGDAYPVLATLAGVPGDRLRWNLAHECGHLILHERQAAGKDIEREADQFAAELLTPLVALDAEMPAHPKLSSLYAMKLRWGVSVQSLIRRARDLQRISDTQYMSLFRQVSARGERMSERYQIAREKPRLYRRMAEVLYGESPTPGLSQLCSWTEAFAQDVLEQYATKSELPSRRVLVGHRASSSRDNVIEFRRPKQELLAQDTKKALPDTPT